MAPKVVLARCDDYEPASLAKALEAVLAPLGGLRRFVEGRSVLLKPNLLSARPPEDAVTTHPGLVLAVARLAQAEGARDVLVGDSPGGRVTRTEEVWERTGLAAALEGSGARLVRFDRPTPVRTAEDSPVPEIPISAVALEAEVIINLPKLKTHGLTVLTCAVKNMFGCVPGAAKAQLHVAAPSPASFAKCLAEVLEATRPALSIVDAVVAMQGNGPSAGEPVHTGCLIAGEDPVAVDVVGARLLSLDPGQVPTIAECVRRGLGSDKPQTVGARIEPAGGAPPKRMLPRWLPEPLLRAAGRFVRVWPRPDAGRCRRCGICVKECPTGAMMDTGGVPRVERSRCIRCLCCFELCPHEAIEIARSLAARGWL